MLRACGVNYDIRKGTATDFIRGSSFDSARRPRRYLHRLMMRALEMRESVEILKQALAQVQPGPVMNPKVKIRAFRPPSASVRRIEDQKGSSILFNQRRRPKSVPLSGAPPSFINLTVLEDLCLGHTVAT